MCKIEKLNKYLKSADPDRECVVFDTFNDYISQLKYGDIFCEYFTRHLYDEVATVLFKFVKTEDEAREFVNKAIDAGDGDFIEVAKYAHQNGLTPFEVCMGADGYARFNITENGLLDNA